MPQDCVVFGAFVWMWYQPSSKVSSFLICFLQILGGWRFGGLDSRSKRDTAQRLGGICQCRAEGGRRRWRSAAEARFCTSRTRKELWICGSEGEVRFEAQIRSWWKWWRLLLHIEFLKLSSHFSTRRKEHVLSISRFVKLFIPPSWMQWLSRHTKRSLGLFGRMDLMIWRRSGCVWVHWEAAFSTDNSLLIWGRLD